ncbi:uncharacterized protein FIESC28_06072 [Fusarium coffeatum]|uniref:Uncharacterized protein n=1 Tax=Fusarium coffeatum TaxID=231269 RepID=A0A366RMD9_9HYPO|nr:uncharacterized protein FIESC28_06072 [Fusarium coffeatum]RBR18299.1 hypothetical protein FIESC28_06072 [Fusarium coffeatum]
MGMQGPLTAQALGRSPYDDVVEWDSDHDDLQNGGDSNQQFDHRGRPINPETKRINRDIIRSHNEVMLVIGVAEQENPTTSPEAESDKRHAVYEDDVGTNLAVSALRCVDAAGAFGLDGFRQRILLCCGEIGQTDCLAVDLSMKYGRMTTTWIPPDRPRERPEHRRNRSSIHDVSPIRPVDGQMPSDTGPVEAVRRPSTFSARGDDYASDEEDNEGVSATLISFDVEATAETSEAPPGLWSAELRPSVDARGAIIPTTTYCDTMLTQLPPLIASHIFADAALRLATAPWEATALRLIAGTFRQRLGLSTHDICGINLLGEMNLTFAINFLGSQVLHLAVCGEVWAAFTAVATVFHTSPEEWREAEEEEQGNRADWQDERI